MTGAEQFFKELQELSLEYKSRMLPAECLGMMQLIALGGGLIATRVYKDDKPNSITPENAAKLG